MASGWFGDAPEATCVGCGCTDSNPCAGGCSWRIAVRAVVETESWESEPERKIGAGICTSCHLDERTGTALADAIAPVGQAAVQLLRTMATPAAARGQG